MPMTPQRAVRTLTDTPEVFLRGNRLAIACPTNLVGLRTVYLNAMADSYIIQTFNAGGARMDAYCIPMSLTATKPSSAQINAVFQHVPSNAPEANFIITGQLTGCSFVVRPSATGLDLTHVQPQGSKGAKLRRHLQKQTELTVFGRGTKNTGNLKKYLGGKFATVIGVYSANDGGWKLYAQAQDAYQNICWVRQIYP